METDEWYLKYSQLVYALEFDSKRLAGDPKHPALFPL